MRVRVLQSHVLGGSGIAHAGDVIELDDHVAQSRIRMRYVEPVTDPPSPAGPSGPVSPAETESDPVASAEGAATPDPAGASDPPSEPEAAAPAAEPTNPETGNPAATGRRSRR